MTGSKMGAEKGTLLFMTGGALSVHEELMPVMMAMGGGVRGGLYGTAPVLNNDPANPTLENNTNDVRFETDFRSVYAQVIDQWLGAGSSARQVLDRLDTRLLGGLRKQRVARLEVRVEAPVREARLPHHVGDADALVAVFADGAGGGTQDALTRLLLLGICLHFSHMTDIIFYLATSVK